MKKELKGFAHHLRLDGVCTKEGEWYLVSTRRIHTEQLIQERMTGDPMAMAGQWETGIIPLLGEPFDAVEPAPGERAQLVAEAERDGVVTRIRTGTPESASRQHREALETVEMGLIDMYSVYAEEQAKYREE